SHHRARRVRRRGAPVSLRGGGKAGVPDRPPPGRGPTRDDPRRALALPVPLLASDREPWNHAAGRLPLFRVRDRLERRGPDAPAGRHGIVPEVETRYNVTSSHRPQGRRRGTKPSQNTYVT